MNSNIYGKYELLLDNLIDINMENRDTYSRNFTSGYCSAEQYAAEFCTIRLDLGRAVGKTSYIISHAGPDDLIIVSHHRHINDLARKTDTKIINGQFFNMYNTMGNSFFLSLRHHKTIWIDEPGGIDMNSVYSFTVSAFLDQTYIILGD